LLRKRETFDPEGDTVCLSRLSAYEP
jgi:hypothetical protein